MKIVSDQIKSPTILAKRDILNRTVKILICDEQNPNFRIAMEISDLDFNSISPEGCCYTHVHSISESEESSDRPHLVDDNVSQQEMSEKVARAN
jgi:hypothetical protein